MKSLKFYLAVFWLLLCIIGSYLSIIFYITDYSDVLRLENINYHNYGFFKYDITLKQDVYQLLAGTYWVIAAIATTVLICSFFTRNWLQQELSFILAEISQVLHKFFQSIKQLTKTEKAVSLSILVLIMLVRIYYLNHHYLTTDEAASFDYFVTEGPLAVSSFYPIPNNHIFSNLISLLFYQLPLQPLQVMRVPTLLIGLGGTFLMYVVLIRYCGFAIATFSLVMLSFSQMGIFYAFAGRGYFLLTTLAFVNFISMLRIMYRSANHKVYWLLFIISGILGFYTVPTFLYPFTTSLVIGFFYFLKNKATNQISNLIVSGFLVSICTIALYLPLIFISGLDALINNEYVRPLSSQSFWSGFPLYFAYTEGALIGQERLGIYILFIVLVISTFKIFYFKEQGIFLKTGVPALIMVFFPYLLIITQRIHAPERALFYKSVYLCVVIGLLFFWLLRKTQINRKHHLLLAGLALTIYSSYQIYHLQKQLIPARIVEQQRIATFRWLKNFKPRTILVPDPTYSLFLNHYFKTGKIDCRIDSEKKAGAQYDFLILPKTQDSEPDSTNSTLKKEVYANDFVRVYSLRGYN